MLTNLVNGLIALASGIENGLKGQRDRSQFFKANSCPRVCVTNKQQKNTTLRSFDVYK